MKTLKQTDVGSRQCKKPTMAQGPNYFFDKEDVSFKLSG